MLLPLLGLLVGVLAGLVLNVNVSFELSRYSAVAILAALDSVLGAVRAELDGVYDNRIFISGFLVNAIIAVILTFIGDRLGLDLYLVALITFGLRIFNNVALIRRHFLRPPSGSETDDTVEREAVLVGIDVGTSKVCALIGEVSRDGRLTIIGHGTVPASGLKKGVVINIDQTVRSIADAVERAERLSGWKIDRAFVGVGGQHVESLNSRGPGRGDRPTPRGHARGHQPRDRGRPRGRRSRRTARCSTSCGAASPSTARRASRIRSG